MANASDYLIALDDGHGQETAGNRTPLFQDGSFMKENDFTRAVVAKMDVSLRRCGFRVLLAAQEDEDVSLKLRTDRANSAQANFYLSVHANAMGSTWQTIAYGIETYHYPGSKDGEQAKLLLSDKYRNKCAEALTKGICEYFGVPYVSPVEELNIPRTPIMGNPICSAEQMDLYVMKVNPDAPRLAGLFLQIGKKYGVCGDLAFSQSILETGFFRFEGDVKPQQNNYAGIGATGGSRGNSFATPEEGITAQIQHLFAYASKNPLPAGETLVDPRFNLVVRGSAPNLEELAGRWAVPGYDRNKYSSLQEALIAGDTYGQNIAKIARKMSKIEVSPFDRDNIRDLIREEVSTLTKDISRWNEETLRKLIREELIALMERMLTSIS